MLKVSNHSVAYGQSTIIRDLNLDVNDNEIVAVVGRNGMGKTTLMKSLTMRENIETGLAAVGEKKVPRDLYELFPVLEEMQHRRGGNLSGGQQQQLAIARALATRPKVLLLDEPTEGIQPSIIQEMARTLKRIRDERGLSIVVSEQVLSFVMEIADRILVIEKGDIVHQEDKEDADQNKIASYLAV